MVAVTRVLTLGVMAPNHDLRLMTRTDLETHVGSQDIPMVEEIEGGRILGRGLLLIAARKDEGHGHENGL